MKKSKMKFKRIRVVGDFIMGYEPYFDKFVEVARIDKKSKVVTPAHGYFYPHHYGKASKSYASRNGMKFNNR